MRPATGVLALVTAAFPLLLLAQAPRPALAGVQTQLGDLLMNEARFAEAATAYRRAVAAAAVDPSLRNHARAGLVLALLRIGDFPGARGEAEQLETDAPDDPPALAIYGDAMWASGLFEEAEAAYDRAAGIDAGDARARHGRARALASRGHLAEALIEAQDALRLSPREAEFHHTLGSIYERLHQFDQAAAAFGSYVNLLPNHDRSEKAAWARAEIRFLDSFHGRVPMDIEGDAGLWTVPITIVGDKVMVRAKVNGSRPTDFVLDTGAELTVVSRDVARQRGIAPVAYVQTAGVGDVGLRGLQVGRIRTIEIGDLKVRDVPCLIKNPPLGELPGREPESFSPLALGLSMQVDYARRELVMARRLPDARSSTELPLRLYRLATVRGAVNGRPASFVVDTGGEVISISAAAASRADRSPTAGRRIPLKVYGTSGWDREAFLMPNVDLQFSSLRLMKTSVVVLNLKAPSELLGFELGGIVGHRFLSQYRVTLDLTRSVLGLDGPDTSSASMPLDRSGS